MTHQQIKVRNLEISVNTKGSGSNKYLFLHGWGGDSNSWEPLISELNPNNTYITFDFPGFGQSEIPSRPFFIKDYAEIVYELINQLKLTENLTIILHSFGGRIILKLFELYPVKMKSLLNRIVLIAPAGIKHDLSTKKKIIVKLSSTFGGLVKKIPLLRTLWHKLIGAQDYSNTNENLKQTFQNVINEDLSPQIDKINVENVQFFGRNDTYVPIIDAKSWLKATSSEKQHIFEDGRHAIHKTHAKQIAKILQS